MIGRRAFLRFLPGVAAAAAVIPLLLGKKATAGNLTKQGHLIGKAAIIYPRKHGWSAHTDFGRLTYSQQGVWRELAQAAQHRRNVWMSDMVNAVKVNER